LAKIVFDLFHVAANYNRIIDKLRNREYRKAGKEDVMQNFALSSICAIHMFCCLRPSGGG